MLQSTFYRNALQCLTPPVDIYETNQEILVFAEMPGVPQDQMEIEVTGRELTIRGYVRDPLEGQRLIREFPRCDYFRVFRLSDAIDTEHITASVANGVLTLTLPKKPQAKPVEIPIETE